MPRKGSARPVAIGKSVAVDKPTLRLHLSRGRLRVVSVAVAIAFGALMVRAVYASLLQPDKVRKVGLASTTRTISTKASRGKILDRNGIVLASSLPAGSVAVNPQVFAEATTDQRRKLAALLGLEPAELARKIRNGSRLWAGLARNVELTTIDAIKDLDIPGLADRPGVPAPLSGRRGGLATGWRDQLR